MKEADEFRSRGIVIAMDTSDYVTIAERKARLAQLDTTIEDLLKTHLPKARNLDIVILKCHLLIEFMFNQYIDLIAPTEGIIEDPRFTFKQKQILVHLLGFSADPLFMPSIDIINKLRNQVAHTLSIDRKLIDKLIRLNAATTRETNHLTDSERSIGLKQITKFLCGMMLGDIKAKHEIGWIDEPVEQGMEPTGNSL